jgi:AcrR family transcriptional regulator
MKVFRHYSENVTDTDIHRRPGGRSARVRRAVLDATLAALSEHGVAALSVNDVAARADVHETSIYRRWRTRDNLILDAVLSHSEQSLPIPDTGSLRGDLMALLDELAVFLTSPLGNTLAHVLAAAAQDPASANARADFWQARRQAVQPVFDRAIKRGELPAKIDWPLLVEVLSAPLHYRTLVSHEPLDSALHPRLIDLVLNGVGDQKSADRSAKPGAKRARSTSTKR